MLKQNGEQDLRDFTEQTFQEAVEEVVPGVWIALSIGHSNAIFIEGETSVILVDTLDTGKRGERLRDIIHTTTGKEVKTIIYTHNHVDHRGGGGAFDGSDPETIAFAPCVPVLEHSEMVQDVLNKRGARQFGFILSDEENISQGIGIRTGAAYGEARAFRKPTVVYDEEKVIRQIDGVTIEMARIQGETDDQIMVWLPDKRVLCCGDNYYSCWPNLYAIRGGQYRDIAAWVKSLDIIRSYQAEYLLPGHTKPVCGRARVEEVLTNFRNAISYVLEETLRGMNEGKDMDTLASEITLPEEYAHLPYLGEYYGTVDWTVRAIFTAYAGWFDGNPTHLHPLSPKLRGEKSVALMGGAEAVLNAAKTAIESGEYQWALELCDLLLNAGERAFEARRWKAEALRKIAPMETSANGRHYYLVSAYELEKEN